MCILIRIVSSMASNTLIYNMKISLNVIKIYNNV